MAERCGVLVVTSSDSTVRSFLLGHIRGLLPHYDVTVTANCPADQLQPHLPHGTHFAPNHIQRPIKPLADLKELIRLTRTIRHNHYWAVHTYTPKAGLLGITAATLARTPIRIHTFTGQVWATRTGPTRTLLRTLDKLVATLATHTLVDGHSQRQYLIDEHVLKPHQGTVLAQGSIAGVDTERFKPNPTTRHHTRTQHGITDTDTLAVFIGRLNHDKGVPDLVKAFTKARQHHPNLHLMLVGPDEEHLTPTLHTLAGPHHHHLHITGPTTTPEHHLTAADIVTLPSYREGFGVSVLEAAACAVPAIVSRIYGLADSIIDGETGLFHDPGDTDQLADALVRLCEDEAERRFLGANARRRAIEEFGHQVVTDALVAFYDGLRGAPATVDLTEGPIEATHG